MVEGDKGWRQGKDQTKRDIQVGTRNDDHDDEETQEKEVKFDFSGDKGDTRGKEDMMETVLKYGRGEIDKGPGVKVRKEERPRSKGVREKRILTHRGMTVTEGQGGKGKIWQGEGWREETMAAAMPTIGANTVITLAAVGSGFCSSQGLPVKRVESSLQDVNKPGGRQGP